ncbi:hypothetical protein MXB_5644, partial [Myxobolus squamalis]
DFNLPIDKKDLVNLKNFGSIELKITGKVVETCLAPNPLNLNPTSSLPTMDFSKYNKNFSSFFKSIFVEFDPTVYGPGIRSLEWVRSLKTPENDGFVVNIPFFNNKIRRPILCKNNFNVTFVFGVNYNPPQFALSEPLSCLLGVEFQTKAHIISLFWRYISSVNNLLDPYSPNIVHCDESLKNIFRTDQFNIDEIPTLLLPHLLPLKPHTFSVEIQNPLSKSVLSAGVYSSTPHHFDITTEPFIVEYDNKTISMDINEIQLLDQKAKQISETITLTKNKICDYKKYVHDPSSFISHWLNNKYKSYSNLQSGPDNKHVADEERSSEFFSRPWIQEYVHFNVIQVNY